LANPGAKLDETTIRESMQVIDEETERLTELINNMLDASRAQGGGFKLSPVELDIDEMVVRAVHQFQKQTRNHTLRAEISRDLPLVWADEARITQVLRNLIGNAIKYSPEGGEITVSGRTTPGDVIISVRDQGKGVPPADLPHVFDRFFRGSDAITKRTPGTGLGLYLARIFVESHGGRIWAESDGKTGSTFSFSLPRLG
jgi:signal transduction histidine kinase